MGITNGPVIISDFFDVQIMTHSVPTPYRAGSKSCDFNFVFGLIISLYTVSNATNKHCYWLP